MRPGREHDTTTAHAELAMLDMIRTWISDRDDRQVLADLGYEGESDLVRAPFKKPAGDRLTVNPQSLQRPAQRPARPGRTSQLSYSKPPTRPYVACATVPGASAI